MQYLIIILLAFITLGVQAQKKDRIVNNKITPDSIATQIARVETLKFNDGTSMSTAVGVSGDSKWEEDSKGIKYTLPNGDSVTIKNGTAGAGGIEYFRNGVRLFQYEPESESINITNSTQSEYASIYPDRVTFSGSALKNEGVLYLVAHSCILTDGSPTQAELVTCLGAATGRSGDIMAVIDYLGTDKYQVISNGTNWSYLKYTTP